MERNSGLSGMMTSKGKIHVKVKPKDRIFRVKVKPDG
jgi:hypothetical protein